MTDRSDETRTNRDPIARTAGVAQPGDRISDRYRVLETLGAGGFGDVLLALDERLGREVALKVLTADGDEADFLREARAIARLDHPHVVPVYDAFVFGRHRFVVMRRIEGAGLDRVLADTGPLDPETAVRVVRQVAEALAHAHARGLVHRDVKPANVLLERGRRTHAWLVDFGVAKWIDPDGVATSGRNPGTVPYMAPEQITGRSVDPRTDVWALGCLAVEVITGRRAFDGNSIGEIVQRILEGEPDGLDRVRRIAGTSYALAARAALAKSPDDRPERTSDLVEIMDRGELPESGPADASAGGPVRKPTEVVDVRGIGCRYGLRGTDVLRGLDLRIERGAIYALLGRNGAGKSTLLRVLLGLQRARSGTIRLFGRDPRRHRRDVLRQVGFCPDQLDAWPWMRVGQLFAFLSRGYPNWSEPLATRLLARFELPIEARLRTLSRGMSTKVIIAAALAARPKLLVMDDPTLGLDAIVRRDVFETLREIATNEGTTVLIASHQLEEMESVVTHVGLLADGRIRMSGTVARLRASMRRIRLRFATSAPTLPAIDNFREIGRSGPEVVGVLLEAGDADAVARLRSMRPETLDVDDDVHLRDLFVGLLG